MAMQVQHHSTISQHYNTICQHYDTISQHHNTINQQYNTIMSQHFNTKSQQSIMVLPNSVIAGSRGLRGPAPLGRLGKNVLYVPAGDPISLQVLVAL